MHNGKPPKEKIVMPFSMLLNLVGSSNADNKEILWKFINKFHKEIKPQDYPILDGNCKLQWKVDWAMRWFTFDVDFEMYGKDLTESAILSNKICRALGKIPPNGFAYELFLDEKGEKISKSKGNGISIEQWLRYASPESLSLYMYPNPKRAKKLYSEVVPKTVDEYLSLIEKYPNQKEKDQIINPVWQFYTRIGLGNFHCAVGPSKKAVSYTHLTLPTKRIV